MSPILPFTTEEAWEALADYKGKTDSVHLQFFPDFKEQWLEEAEFGEWERLGNIREEVLKKLEEAREGKIIGNSLEAREDVLKKLEEAREGKIIGNSLEAQVTVHADSSSYPLLEKYKESLPELFIVSSVSLKDDAREEVKIEVCSWNYSPEVGSSQKYPEFCKRCEQVVDSIKK